MDEKACTVCSATKPFVEFYKNPRAKDGLRAGCKACDKLADQKRYAANPGRNRARDRKQEEDARRLAEQSKPCTVCSATKSFAAFSKDPRAKDGLHSRCKACDNLAVAKWRKDNPGKHNANSARWRAAKLRRTPPWADLKAIQQFYVNRPEGKAGDHIIPLRGKLVSGLHVLANLQYLPASKNASKSNNFNPDDWYWVKEK